MVFFADQRENSLLWPVRALCDNFLHEAKAAGGDRGGLCGSHRCRKSVQYAPLLLRKQALYAGTQGLQARHHSRGLRDGVAYHTRIVHSRWGATTEIGVAIVNVKSSQCTPDICLTSMNTFDPKAWVKQVLRQITKFQRRGFGDGTQ